MQEEIEKLADYLRKCEKIVVFTGAGISTESGIPDYRNKGGLWDRFQPVTYQEFLSSEEKRKEYWLHKKELMEKLLTAQPNPGHLFVAELEKKHKKLLGVITQNIDGLHQIAGNSREKVLELHGTNRTIRCLSCEKSVSFEKILKRIQAGEESPNCIHCEGILKPDTISFGQSLNPEILSKSFSWARDCDLCLCLGSTLIVEPAASIPLAAKQSGAKLVIVNLSLTPLDSIADLVVCSTISKVLGPAGNLLKLEQVQ